jgi:SAM-dependent methyltransferase
VIDYENSRYRQEFWEGQGREYEDLVERIALGALLPPVGDTLVEIGAGYGRLYPLYEGYKRVVLVDYARTQLEEAQRYLPDPQRYTLVATDVYNLPFVDSAFDTVTMVRVMHHLADVAKALSELQRVIKPGGAAVVEYANKRNLKAVGRWLLRRQDWNPFERSPVEFVEMNFDFHPGWMQDRFEESGLFVDARRSVSHFRIPLLKRTLPPRLLAAVDGWIQPIGRWIQFSPSTIVRARSEKPTAAVSDSLFRCPACHSVTLTETESHLICGTCGRQWQTTGGIYDFRKRASS